MFRAAPVCGFPSCKMICGFDDKRYAVLVGLFGCSGGPSGEGLILQEGGGDPKKWEPNFHIRGVFNPRVANFSQTGSGKKDGGCDSGRQSRGKGKGRNADV